MGLNRSPIDSGFELRVAFGLQKPEFELSVTSAGTIALGAVDVAYRNRLHSEQLVTALERVPIR